MMNQFQEDTENAFFSAVDSMIDDKIEELYHIIGDKMDSLEYGDILLSIKRFESQRVFNPLDALNYDEILECSRISKEYAISYC